MKTKTKFNYFRCLLLAISTLYPLLSGWANFLTPGPQWVLKFDRGAGPGADGCSVSVN